MKQYIILKKSPSIQLAHLYEHIFCMQINRILRDKKMYLYSDYNLIGKTYHGGLIYIEYSQYAKNCHINIKKIISNLKIDFKTNITDIGISQLIAEKESLIWANNYDGVIAELNKLHKESWIDIDNFGIINAKEIRRKSYPLFLAEDKVPKIQKLSISMLLNEELAKDQQILIPLFRQVGYLILTNLEYSICDTYGGFGIDIIFKEEKSVKLTDNIRLVSKDLSIDDSLITLTEDLVSSLVNDGAAKRLINNLSSMLYKNGPDNTVNFEHNYEDTLFFIGSKGWKSIANQNNINLLLDNSSIELKLGNKTKDISLLPIIK